MRNRVFLLILLSGLVLISFLVAGCGQNKRYTLYVEVQGKGSVTPSSGTQFEQKTIVKLTPVDQAGWAFKAWAGPDCKLVTSNPWQIVMDGDKHLTAVFEQLPFALNITVTGNGHVDKLSKEGNIVLLTAVPDSGWEFARWEGDASGTMTTYEVTLNSDKSVTAVFTKQSSSAEPRLKRNTLYSSSSGVLSTFDYQYDSLGRISRVDYANKTYPSASFYSLYVYESDRVTSTNYSLSGTANMQTIEELLDGKIGTRTVYYPIDKIYFVTTFEYNADGTLSRYSDQYPLYPSYNQYFTYTYSPDCIVINNYRTSDDVLIRTETQEYSGGKLMQSVMTHPGDASQNYYDIYEYPIELTIRIKRYAGGVLSSYNVLEYECP